MIDIRERPKTVEHAFLVGVRINGTPELEVENLLDELDELVRTLHIEVAGRQIVHLRELGARYLLGSGKTEEIVHRAKDLGCDCIVFDAELSPAQQRNWEALSGLCVIDRQEVILDIFNERAQTKEAVLQVELARAEHSLPRLKNAWTHLSRQRGGGGVTQRGEGEAQIELDARMVRQRIARLKRELEEVVRHRDTQRKRRQRVPLPSGAIVGYTNAGKSTLLNALTGANVLAEDKLFATLDPTTRQLVLEGGQKVLLTDTVGFVRRLPHRLVEAFKATLEESIVADFLLHVVDISHPEAEAQMETTLEVLRELGADQKRIFTVYNKADLLPALPEGIERNGQSPGVYVSARSGEGLEALRARIGQLIAEGGFLQELLIPYDRYEVLNRLHQAGAVRHTETRDEGLHVVAQVPPRLTGLVAEFAVA